MKTRFVGSAILAGALFASVTQAASPVIGTATARGAFRVDNATVTGNATLFEGATIETHTAGTALLLPGRARVALSPGSKGKLYGDRLLLEKGEARLEQGAGFRFEARGLTIQPATGTASARVAVGSNVKVQVVALNGTFRVLNARGMLIANVVSGSALEFDPQASSGPTRLSGCLLIKSGHFVLTDETTQVTVELAGPGVAKEVGNRVSVTGSMDSSAAPVSDASQFIRVTEVSRVAKGCLAGKNSERAGAGGAAAAGKGGSGSGGGGGTGTGITVATIAVIGGVAVAATLGGLAAKGALPGQSDAGISR